jgi:hypothetical protein
MSKAHLLDPLPDYDSYGRTFWDLMTLFVHTYSMQYHTFSNSNTWKLINLLQSPRVQRPRG